MCILSSLGLGLGTSLGLGAAASLAGDVMGGLALTSSVLGGVNSYMTSQQQQEAASYQADMAETNRLLSERKADDIAEQGEWQKRNLSLKQKAQAGEARASFGASGTALGSGSILHWEASNAEVDDADMSQLNYDIKNNVYDAKMAAWNYENQRNMFNYQSDAARTNGYVGLINSGIGLLSSTVGGYVGGIEAGQSIAKNSRGSSLPGKSVQNSYANDPSKKIIF